MIVLLVIYNTLGQALPYILYQTLTKPTSVDGYTPKNKKVLCYPYNYLLVSNNNGQANKFYYERFLDSSIKFQISGVPVVGCSIKCVPENYEFYGYSQENGIMAGKFPTLNWSSDNYNVWLRQNALNLNIGAGLGLAQIGTGIVSNLAGAGSFSQKIGEQRLKGNVEAWNKSTLDYSGSLGGITSGFEKVLNAYLQNYVHSLQPSSAIGNVNGADINVCQDMNGFFFYQMCIKQEYAKVIDDYFSAFGYKVNCVKIPNIEGRLNWNFVKLGESNIEGIEIPEFELNEYKAQLEKGITFWHNPQTFRDYSQNNNIV